MKLKNAAKWTIALGAVAVIAGCQPAVVTEPPSSTTVIHDKTPSSPNVIVTPPAATPSTHTDTTTNSTTTPTPDGTGTNTTTTKSTTTTTGE